MFNYEIATILIIIALTIIPIIYLINMYIFARSTEYNTRKILEELQKKKGD